jgi:hypothetical protein
MGAGGYVWTQITSGPAEQGVNDLAWDGSGLYVAISQGNVWRYSPGAGTWEDTGGGLNSSHLLWAENRLFASTANGVLCYDPTVRKWGDTRGPENTYYVSALCWDGSWLYAGTSGRGIWRYNLSTGNWEDTGGGFYGLYVPALAWDGTGIYAVALYYMGKPTWSTVSWICRYDCATGLWMYVGGADKLQETYSLCWDGSNLYFGHWWGVGCYTPSTGIWNNQISASGVFQGRLLMWNGSSLYVRAYDGVWCYNPATATWSNLTASLGNKSPYSLAWDGNGLYATLYDGQKYTRLLYQCRYTGAPTLSTLSPANGPIGAEVTINGDGFGSSRGNSYVSFGSTRVVDYTSWSTTRITCKVPNMALGDVQVTVTTADGTSNGLPFTVRLPRVEVASINPTSGTDIDASLAAAIMGNDFLSGATVRLENAAKKAINATNVKVVSSGQITCTFDLTGAPLGKYDVVVSNPGGGEARLPGGFAVTNICGQGAGVTLIPLGLMLGLLSLAGSAKRRRRQRGG